jgi:hypothetical protein
VGPRAVLDAVEKRQIVCPSWESNAGRPDRLRMSSEYLNLGRTNRRMKKIGETLNSIFYLQPMKEDKYAE